MLHLATTRLTSTVLAAAASAVVLSACGPGALAPSPPPEPSVSEAPSQTPEPSASASPSASTPASPSASVAPSESPTPPATTPPVAGAMACNELFTSDQVYEFNPNFAPTDEQGALPGALGLVAQNEGTVCAWRHVTGTDRLLIGAVHTELPQPGFEQVDGVGVVTHVGEGMSLVAASEYFESAEDAKPIFDAVMENM